MHPSPLDWAIVAGYFGVSLLVGLAFTRRAGRSTDEYFLGGRTIAWWLAGISIVATTFPADTPLLVTGITARAGIAGNWIWWTFVLSGMLTVFFFARLWRRVGITTDVEFAAIRYSGRPAHVLRVFRALYIGLPIDAVIGGAVGVGLAHWALGCATVYFSLFGLGRLRFGPAWHGAVLLVVAGCCAWGVVRGVRE
jgi:Na+/proline symporter